jgi:hypothetical protein
MESLIQETEFMVQTDIDELLKWYGCETWSLTLTEEHKMRVFENRVLRREFGPKREEGAEHWRRLHNEELRNLYASQNIIRVIKSSRLKRAGHVALIGELQNAYKISIGKLEG